MTNPYTLISLFTGAGGMDLGLEQAGFMTVAANELEPQACETLRRNKELCHLEGEDLDLFISDSMQQRCFNRLSAFEKTQFFERLKTQTDKDKFLQECNVIEGDIRTIASSTFEELSNGDEVFCVAGGPPCQPFSKAGKKKSLDCTKNGDLFFEFVRVVNDIQPKWFLFENVKGITFTKTDVLYQTCCNCNVESLAPFRIRQDFETNKETIPCLNCGALDTDWKIKNEAGGSLKIIFNEFQKVGYRCSFKVLNAADFGAPQMRERLFIVGSREGKEFQWPEPTHTKALVKNMQTDLFANSIKKPWVTMREALWSNGHNYYGAINKETAKLWVKNVVRPHDEPVTWSLDRPSPTIGAHQGAKLAFAPKGVPEKQLFRQQWATKGRKQGDTPPVDVEHKYLTDEELLLLQTFPKWWYLHGTRMQRAFQIGNAVPPLLAYTMGKALLQSEEQN